jgi:hypothetical protein
MPKKGPRTDRSHVGRLENHPDIVKLLVARGMLSCPIDVVVPGNPGTPGTQTSANIGATGPRCIDPVRSSPSGQCGIAGSARDGNLSPALLWN